MNTIKIYLAESGRVADLRKDFPLYQYQFQNKLLNIYVPTSIMAPEFISQNADGTTLSEYVASTSVKIGMSYTARDGSIKKSKNYYVRFLKTLTYQNVEYALYERKLPKEFTLYAGQGGNAPILTANVVNIQQETENGTPIVLSVITTQTCSLDVMASTDLDIDEAVEPTELENINAQINEINEILPTKQDKVDDALETTNKSVVGAINENKAKIDINIENIETNTEDIARNRNDIDELKEIVGTGQEYIGTIEVSSLPSSEVLNTFVSQTKGRQPKGGDTVIVVLEITGDTDRNYKYIYNGETWSYYEIPPVELAGNGTAGLVEGTYSVGSQNNTLVDISGGEILNIYVKDNNNAYRNIREYLNSNATDILDIISGDNIVGEAMKALEDGLGNNIVETYLTKSIGASKQFVRDYAMPRIFNDVYYISSNGYQNNAPTTPASGIQFTKTTSAVGDFQLFQITKTNTADFELSSKNGYSNNIYIASTVSLSSIFRLTTEYKKAGSDWGLLNVELTHPISLYAGEIQKIVFGNPFAYLGEDVVKLTDGDQIRQTLEVVSQSSETVTYSVYSNEIYPSIFNLTSQSYTLNAVEQVIGRVLMVGADGFVQGENAVFEVQNAESYVEFKTNQRKFLFTLYLPIVGTLDENLTVRIQFGDTVYNLYSFMQGSNTPLTLGALKNVMSYNEATGYFFYANFIFIETSDVVGFVIDPAVGLGSGEGGGGSVSIDNESITKNARDEIQAVALKNKAIEIGEVVSFKNFGGGITITEEQYDTLVEDGYIIVDGVRIEYDSGAIYFTDKTLRDLTLSGTSVLTSREIFTKHIQIMVEFETDNIHAGFDCVLHPYDSAVCFVTFDVLIGGQAHFGQAYLNESGNVVINVPSGVSFTNVKAKYVIIGG
ncbi:MAG: hypothetical protein IKI95_07075 [Clostridia bacterium]|nr:hypothetical protein [Clostridia bacterium]